MAAVIAAGAGVALALFGIALENGLAALFWPRLALCILMLGAVAGGLAGLGIALAAASFAERVRRQAVAILALAWVAALATAPAARALAAHLLPGPALDLLSFPLPFLALVSMPFVLTVGVLASWFRTGEQRRCGWLLAGAGAGWLVAVAVAGSSLALRVPWFGGQELEFTPAENGVFLMGIDRRLREDVIAPSSSPSLAFVPAPDESGRAEVLIVGLRNGPLLSALLGVPHARLTILEEDATLVEEVLRRWPALESARADGRALFLGGNPRWTLERSRASYGCIVLSEQWSFGAHLSRALNLHADHGWTVEAFRSYLEHLRPDGMLVVQRIGMGRVVTTLREAAGLAPKAFSANIAVFGGRERLLSELVYRPQGVVDAVSIRKILRHARGSGIDVFYRLTQRKINTVYDRLIEGERVRGLYFSTPLDLSPPVDARPFFDNVERMVLSPSGRSMPEELRPLEPRAPLRIVPSGDRDAWRTFIAGALVAATMIAAGWRRARCGSAASPAGLPLTALSLGACAALALDAFAAWAQWLSPSAATAQTAVGAALLATGGGWLSVRTRAGSRAGLALLLSLLTGFALLGYRAAPTVPRLGILPSALIVIGVGTLLCLVLGRVLGGAALEVEARLPGVGGWFAGLAVCAASLTWMVGRLAVTHFGYSVLWGLAAAAACAAMRGLRRLPSEPST